MSHTRFVVDGPMSTEDAQMGFEDIASVLEAAQLAVGPDNDKCGALVSVALTMAEGFAENLRKVIDAYDEEARG